MLDLLPLVLEEGQPAQSSTDAQEAGSQECGTTAFSQPQARERVVSPATSRPSSKGIMAKYKSYINGRRKSGSDTLDEPQNGRRSAGAEELDNFAPLAHGENGAGSGQYQVDRAAHEQTSPSCQPSPAKEPSKFMDKVRAYKKKSRSTSKSGDLADAPGPLANGINQDAGLQDFFAGVSEAKALLAEVIERQRQITAARERSRTLVKPSEVHAAREQVQDEVEAVTVICKRVKAKLDELDTINAKLLDDDDQEDVPETAALQMRLSVMVGLNAKLADVTKSWQEMRVQWHEEDREEVALQLHTVTGRDYSPEEVEQLVQSGGTETIYRQALSTISGPSVQQAMSDVQARHDQMAQLEASMLELHQVFLDMSILVADQGDTINNIDNWVCSTRCTMQESVRQLRAAKRDRRRAAQTKAITFVTGVGLIAGGAGLTATGVGAVAGVPMIIAGAAAVGGSAIGGIT